MKSLFTKFITLLCLSIITTAAWSQLNFKPANAGNSSGTWSNLGANGTSISMANMDNANSSATSIGFNFDYNGTTYTDFIVNTNQSIQNYLKKDVYTVEDLNAIVTTDNDLNKNKTMSHIFLKY